MRGCTFLRNVGVSANTADLRAAGCLPRVNGRPMTRDIAARTRMRRIASPSGYQGWCTSMIIVPEDEAAALQCMTAMMDFATGFELYCKCQHGLRGSVPSLQGVAMTALSGQVLNHAKTHPRLVDLPTLEAAALVFDRPSEPERHVLAAFADKPMRLTFRVPPYARFKTMDLYGNFGRTAADGHGVLTLDLKAMAPACVFGVPGEIAAVSPMKMTFPSELPDGGCARARSAACRQSPSSARCGTCGGSTRRRARSRRAGRGASPTARRSGTTGSPRAGWATSRPSRARRARRSS